MTTSGIVPRRSSVRSIAITGVTPEPATRNKSFAGGGSGSTKSPSGSASRTIVPGSRPLTRCDESSPSGMARTVMEIVRPLRFGAELTEYERHWNLPLTCTPMPTYCPGRWS